jgi:hypothetical protein
MRGVVSDARELDAISFTGDRRRSRSVTDKERALRVFPLSLCASLSLSLSRCARLPSLCPSFLPKWEGRSLQSPTPSRARVVPRAAHDPRALFHRVSVRLHRSTDRLLASVCVLYLEHCAVCVDAEHRRG